MKTTILIFLILAFGFTMNAQQEGTNAKSEVEICVEQKWYNCMRAWMWCDCFDNYEACNLAFYAECIQKQKGEEL